MINVWGMKEYMVSFNSPVGWPALPNEMSKRVYYGGEERGGAFYSISISISICICISKFKV